VFVYAKNDYISFSCLVRNIDYKLWIFIFWKNLLEYENLRGSYEWTWTIDPSIM